MIWQHGIPDASVVFLLLLFITPSGLGKDCFWEHNPFPTAFDQSHEVKTLKGWMLLDYPVSVPTNLKQNEFCRKLWDLHFINKELVQMAKVSGENLTATIKKLTTITNFVAECKIKENDCIHFEQRNVSQFLDSIPSIYTALKQHMDVGKGLDFSNCTIVQCQLDIKDAEQKTEKSLFFTTSKTKQAEQTTVKSLFFSTQWTKQAEQDSQPSQAATSREHYWWLILLLIVLLLLAVVVGARLKHRQQSLNLPLEPPEQL